MLTKSPHHENRAHYKGVLSHRYFDRLITLNYKPLDWVHEDWLQEVPNIHQIRKINTSRLQSHIAKQLEIGALDDLSFSDDPIKRLIFLPNTNLQRLLSILGLSCFKQQLTLIVEKRIKEQLYTEFGIETCHYIQHKAPLLISEFPPQLKVSEPLKCLQEDKLRSFFPYGYRMLSIAIKPPKQTQDHPTDKHWHHYLSYKLPKFEPLPKDAISLSKIEWDRLRIYIKKLALEQEPLCTNLLK